MTESKLNDVYVQILPVIKSGSSNNILLCKWIKGDFKDRYTGLIKSVDFKVIRHKKINTDEHLKKYIRYRSQQTIQHFGKNSKR